MTSIFHLLVHARPIGEAADFVTCATVTFDAATLERWQDYTAIVRRLMQGDNLITTLDAWCGGLNFHRSVPLPPDHPLYAEACVVAEGDRDWLLLREDVMANDDVHMRRVRSDVDMVHAWGANLVFAGRGKYSDDHYETTYVNIFDLAKEVARG